MNTSIKLLCATVTALAVPLSVLANNRDMPKNQANTSDQSMSSGDMSNVQRTTEQTVDRELTAKDLLGKNVYDSSGDEIGAIVDVVLPNQNAGTLAQALSDQKSSNSSRGSASDNGNRYSNPNSSSTTGNPSSSSSNSMNGTSSSSDRYANSGAGTYDSSSSARGSSSNSYSSGTSNYSSTSSDSNAPCAIISYGGFLGMNNTLVKVPISSLNFDSNKDHLVLNVTKQQLDGLKVASNRE